MSLLIITGLSGAGKTVVSDALEDIGYKCIDNLPVPLLTQVAKLTDCDNMAVVVESSSVKSHQIFLQELEKIEEMAVDYKLVFLDCDKDIIMGRYKYTRRPHPLMSEEVQTLQSAIDLEFELTREARLHADLVVDTSQLSGSQLRRYISDTFRNDGYTGITIKIMSFGFRNGLPLDSDLVYDVRCMPNPYYDAKCRNLSGMDQEVVDFVFGFEQSQTLLEKMEDYIRFSLPYFAAEGKTELVVAIGCTSGHHRSVAFTRKLAEKLEDLQHKIVIIHRDMDKEYDLNKK